jgi:hypothetical protein
MTRLIAGNSSLAAPGRGRRSPVTSHSVNWFVYFPNKLVKGQHPDPCLGPSGSVPPPGAPPPGRPRLPGPAQAPPPGRPRLPGPAHRTPPLHGQISDAGQPTLSGLILVCGRYGRKLLTQVWWFDGSGDHERDGPRHSHRGGAGRDPRTVPDPSPWPELVIIASERFVLGPILEAPRPGKVGRSPAQVGHAARAWLIPRARVLVTPSDHGRARLIVGAFVPQRPSNLFRAAQRAGHEYWLQVVRRERRADRDRFPRRYCGSAIDGGAHPARKASRQMICHRSRGKG